jgi:hypothetical protein
VLSIGSDADERGGTLDDIVEPYLALDDESW